MIVNNLDLDIAVAEGIISRDQAMRLRDLSSRHMAAGDAPIDFSQDTRDEPFRLLRGFRDVFIAIGVVVFAVGLSAIALTVMGQMSLTRGDWVRSGGPSGWAIAVALVLCVFGWFLAEIITRRQRLPLSSLVVSIAFGAWSALLFAAIALSLTLAATSNVVEAGQAAKWSVGWTMIAGAILGIAVFYWRFRLPFALLLLAGAFVGLSLLIVRDLTGAGWTGDYGRALTGLWGLAIFAAAMMFDLKDRLRVTRLSECAFWLHLLAAPMLVHALLLGGSFGAPKLIFVLAAMVVLSLVALLIDRRALLVSGLGYFTVALSRIVSGSALFGDQKFAVTAFVLGAFLLALGLGWTPIRRAAMVLVPFEGLKSRLPPTAV